MNAALAAHIARYHVAHKELGSARTVLQAIPADPPPSESECAALAQSWCALAHAHLADGDIQQATSALDSARALTDDPEVWRTAATVAATVGDARVELDYRRRIVARDDSGAADWLALARACERQGATGEAAACYLRAAQIDSAHGTTLTVAARLAALAPPSDASPSSILRIALVGTSTLEHLRSYLEVQCRLVGLAPETYVGPFGQYAQDILADESPLYRFAPQIIVLALHGRALFPALYSDLLNLNVEERQTTCEQAVGHVLGLVERITSRSEATVLLHTFATPQHSPLGVQELRDPFGQSACFQTINEAIAQRVREQHPSVHLIDEDRIFGRVGKRHVTDPRMWHLARIGYGPAALQALSQEYMRFIKAARGRARKCLAVDLDNTLWGGVVGEEGLSGIRLGQDGPGGAYRAFQEAILQLWQRGIILAIVSKNNELDALEALERHPDMVLRPHHFAAIRINWQDKASNLVSIAEELNIGLDSIAFLDDNPTECSLVRAALPQVLTVQLPPDPAAYRATLLEMTDFDSLTLTAEDRQRGALYAQRRKRQEWQAQHVGNLEAYLADLAVVVRVARADELSIPRIAQLIGKTNQFNLTNRRHTEAVVRRFADSGDWLVQGVWVSDRFGDHGLVGAVIVAQEGAAWEIDTFLLSCRVLGCGVETLVLSALVQVARVETVRHLRGVVVPTAKNAPAQEFYQRNGFERLTEAEGLAHWELDLQALKVETPSWVTLHVDSSATREMAMS